MFLVHRCIGMPLAVGNASLCTQQRRRKHHFAIDGSCMDVSVFPKEQRGIGFAGLRKEVQASGERMEQEVRMQGQWRIQRARLQTMWPFSQAPGRFLRCERRTEIPSTVACFNN